MIYVLDNFKWYRKFRGGKWVLLECFYPRTWEREAYIKKYWYKIDKQFILQYYQKLLKEENYN